MKKCAGCGKWFLMKGGVIRVPAENEDGYHEFPICESCAVELEKAVPYHPHKD